MEFKFDIAGFTNFSEDHISKYEHHSLDEYFDAKVSLLKKVPKVVINWDDEKVKKTAFKKKVFMKAKIKILNAVEDFKFTINMF